MVLPLQRKGGEGGGQVPSLAVNPSATMGSCPIMRKTGLQT